MGSFSKARTTWTPMPSSPMITLPSPSTSVFLFALTPHLDPTISVLGASEPARFVTPWCLCLCYLGPLFRRSLVFRHLVELPSTDDGRDGSASLDVVVVEGEIDMDHDEDHEEPQEQVMPITNAHLTAHERHDPGEHARDPRVAHRGIQCKPGD